MFWLSLWCEVDQHVGWKLRHQLLKAQVQRLKVVGTGDEVLDGCRYGFDFRTSMHIVCFFESIA